VRLFDLVLFVGVLILVDDFFKFIEALRIFVEVVFIIIVEVIFIIIVEVEFMLISSILSSACSTISSVYSLPHS